MNMQTSLPFVYLHQSALSRVPARRADKLFSRKGPATAKTLFCLAFLCGLFVVASVKAASLTPDTNFRAPLFAEAATAGRNLLLPDGKFLLFSRPNTLTDQRTGAITRYLPDGTLDTTFNFSRVYKTVAVAAVAPDGRLYVAATQYIYGKKEAEEILRLNSDGSIDTGFNKTVLKSDIIGTVQQIRVQSDGKVLVAGFIAASFGAGDSIFRLMPDGTRDSSFAGPQVDGFVMASALQNDGKVLIAGNYSNVNGVAHRGIARLNADGSLDSGFQETGFTLGNSIRALVVQNDGKIVMAGHFRLGTPATQRAPLVRLNTDGSLDQTFSSANTVTNLSTARDLVLQPDGKFVATVNSSVYRFNATGSLDSTFRQPLMVNAQLDPGGVAGSPTTIHLLPDGRVLVGGTFTDVDPAGSLTGAHFGAARLNDNGSLDSSLTTTHKTGIETAPSSFARLPDGSTLVGFGDKVEPLLPYNVGRLLSDGAVDPNFTLSSSDPNSFLAGGFSARGLEPLPDGKFFVFGPKPGTGGFTYGKVAANGVHETAFATEALPPFQDAIATPDGKVLLSAGTDAQATVYETLIRLKADGHFDAFALPQSIRQDQVHRSTSGNAIIFRLYVGSRVLAVQPDGKILFEYFGDFSGSNFEFHVLRLNSDGSIDGTFAGVTFNPIDLSENFPVIFDPVTRTTYQPPEGVWTASLPLLDAHVQSDGRIVVVGQFKSYNGVPACGVVRLETNGSVDGSFNIGGGAQWTTVTETAASFPKVENIEAQPDGKLIITGTFEAFNGVAAPGIACLNPDGSVDTSFAAPAFRDKSSRVASALAAQPDGSFLLSGPYRFPNETDTTSLIRLVGPPTTAVNISTRTAVGTGENVLIAGFIITGECP